MIPTARPNHRRRREPRGRRGLVALAAASQTIAACAGFRDGLLYMNVLHQTTIITIPVLEDGSPGEITPYVVTENAFINDGIALDAEGRVYVTDAITNGVIRVDPDGTITPIAGGPHAGFDSPTSIAFGVGATESTMYAVNLAGGSYELNEFPGPALVAIDVDTPGMPLP